MMEKVKAPECPKCGCNATNLVAAGMNRNRPWARYQCEFCQHRFVMGASPLEPGVVNGVTYTEVKCRCPKCDAVNPPVTRTAGRVRYHRCPHCDQRFKSVEAEN